MTYSQFYSTRRTPQSEPIPGKDMAQNNAGGYAFPVDDWSRLDRFLILGAEGGTYYVGQRELTIRNAEAVRRCIQEDGLRVVEKIIEISDAGRAPKNEPALFALAMCASSDFADVSTRKMALESLSKVARIGTHLFHFAEYAKSFRGWGRALSSAVAHWYNDRTPQSLAYQVLKYQSRDGWSHRDLLRLSHPKPATDLHDHIFSWICDKYEEDGYPKRPELYGDPSYERDVPDELAQIWAYELLKANPTEKHAVDLIQKYRLTREMIPTELLNSAEVWEALLSDMPMHAMVRNLGKMTSIGLLSPMSKAAGHVVGQLRNEERVIKSRLHPLSVLVAMRIYAQGTGVRGSLTWDANADIVDALDDCFYLSFGNVNQIGQKIMLALDVSGSMGWTNVAGMPITPREASAAMALVTARTETQRQIMAFCHELVPLSISPRQRLDDVMRGISNLDFGGTDCALPMLYAIENKIGVDLFIVLTDNETWAGSIHPVQALQEYRQRSGIGAKLVVVGMTSSEFSIADPNDGGMIDVAGFDTATPNLIADFAKGF